MTAAEYQALRDKFGSIMPHPGRLKLCDAHEQMIQPLQRLYALERLLGVVGGASANMIDGVVEDMHKPHAEAAGDFYTGLGLLLRDVREELEAIQGTDFEERPEQQAAGARK